MPGNGKTTTFEEIPQHSSRQSIQPYEISCGVQEIPLLNSTSPSYDDAIIKWSVQQFHCLIPEHSSDGTGQTVTSDVDNSLYVFLGNQTAVVEPLHLLRWTDIAKVYVKLMYEHYTWYRFVYCPGYGQQWSEIAVN